jgi:hypothetical protein
MTPSYIRDVFVRRGYAAAMQVAKISQEQNLVNEVMLLNLEKAGVAKPVPIFSRNKRGKLIQTGCTEGATPEELITIKALRERRQSRKVQPHVIASRGLTAAEIARRSAVLKAA